MARKTFGWVLIVVGALGAVVALGADALGIGSYPGIHWAQILGAAIGVVVVLIGVAMAKKR